MACDLIVAAEGTKLGEPEIRYGSAPVTLLMPALIGQKKTRELLLTGRPDRRGRGRADRAGQPGRPGRPARGRGRRAGRPDRPDAARGPAPDEADAQPGDGGGRPARGGRAGLDLGAIINAADTPEQREWDEIVRRDGLKAALAWRDRRYEGDPGRPIRARRRCRRPATRSGAGVHRFTAPEREHGTKRTGRAVAHPSSGGLRHMVEVVMDRRPGVRGQREHPRPASSLGRIGASSPAGVIAGPDHRRLRAA